MRVKHPAGGVRSATREPVRSTDEHLHRQTRFQSFVPLVTDFGMTVFGITIATFRQMVVVTMPIWKKRMGEVNPELERTSALIQSAKAQSLLQQLR